GGEERQRKKRGTVIAFRRGRIVMTRIFVGPICGACLASCPGRTSIEAFPRPNAPPYPTTQHTARKSTLGNRSSPNTEAGTTAKAEPQEAPKSTAQSPSEE